MRFSTGQIDSILPFLEVFEAKEFQFGKWNLPRTEDGKLVISFDSNIELSEQARKFVEALYKNGWIPGFDWPSWQDEAIQYVESPERIASADLDTIRKLFTTHVRKDHFCAGHLAAMFENGHITALLHRVRELRPTVLEEEAKRHKETFDRWRERFRRRAQSGEEQTEKPGSGDSVSRQKRRKPAADLDSDKETPLFPHEE
ncbi:MAG: DUF6508 domain-containing protein [Thermoguttaceae bacterium]